MLYKFKFNEEEELHLANTIKYLSVFCLISVILVMPRDISAQANGREKEGCSVSCGRATEQAKAKLEGKGDHRELEKGI